MQGLIKKIIKNPYGLIELKNYTIVTCCDPTYSEIYYMDIFYNGFENSSFSRQKICRVEYWENSDKLIYLTPTSTNYFSNNGDFLDIISSHPQLCEWLLWNI